MDKDLAWGLVFSLGGLSGFIWSCRNLWLGIQSYHWNLIDCDIIESQIEIWSWRMQKSYAPKISYEYTFDTLHYQGNKVRYGGMWETESDANAYHEKYAEGSTVKVSVDPIHPERSVLVPGASILIYLKIIASIFFGALGYKLLWPYLMD